MYCKFFIFGFYQQLYVVLIVAKCIVNVEKNNRCKYKIYVLIVAKCIVNFHIIYLCINSSKVYCKFSYFFSVHFSFLVLIVAKCIVNLEDLNRWREKLESINSSKVYCKFFFIMPLNVASMSY